MRARRWACGPRYERQGIRTTRAAPEVAADYWTFPAPAGPKGRFLPTLSFFWGIYDFSHNKDAAKELLAFLMQRDKVEARDNASRTR